MTGSLALSPLPQTRQRDGHGREFLFAAVREPLDVTPTDAGRQLGAECDKILFVGEDNPQSHLLIHTLVDYPFGCAGHRLRGSILELPSELYLACWRMNLCAEPNLREHGYQDGHWKKKVAETVFYRDVLDQKAPWQLVVLLGSKVRGASGFTSLVGSFDTLLSNDRTFVTLPHPSGRCREWNDYQRARKILRQYTTLPIGSTR